jgi:hypothetical protein
LNELLNVERLNRIRTSNGESTRKWIDQIAYEIGVTFDAELSNQVLHLNRLKIDALVEKLMKVADHPKANVATSAAALEGISSIGRSMKIFGGDSKLSSKQTDEMAFELFLTRKIRRFLTRPENVAPKVETPTIPPGSPIGGGR